MPVYPVFAAILFLLLVFGGTTTVLGAPWDKKPTPEQALQKLKDGNQRFAAGKAQNPHADAARLKLAASQNQGDHALATIISCSDSRVPVEILFDAGVMDVFVIRVAGNVVQTDEAGSIEYGLAHVYTPVLVVLGHTQCGAVNAVTQAVQGHGHPLEFNIPPLVKPIVPAVKKAQKAHPEAKGADLVPFAIEQNVWQSMEDLFMKSPAVRKLVAEGKVKAVGAMYELETGKVHWLDEARPAAILAEVEKNPKRNQKAMAD